MSSSDSASNANLPVTGHLSALRGSLLWSVVPFLAASVLGTALSGRILDWIFAPLRSLGLAPYLFHLGDAVLLRIRAGVLAGTAATAPWTAWQLYRFARPGLRETEAKTVRRLCLAAGLGFTIGAFALFLWAAPELVGRWSAGRGEHTMLSAGAYFTMWETACLWAGVAGAGAATLPPGISMIKNRIKKRRVSL